MNELTAEWVAKIEPLELCMPLDASFSSQRDTLMRLEHYAVRYRYPGESADKDEARLAFQTAKAIRAFVQDKLEIADERRKALQQNLPHTVS